MAIVTSPKRFRLAELRCRIVDSRTPLLADTLAANVPQHLLLPLLRYYRRHAPQPWRVVVLDEAGKVVRAELRAFARPHKHQTPNTKKETYP